MKQPFFEKEDYSDGLIFRYEATSQKEAVANFEEADFWWLAKAYLSKGQPGKALNALDDAMHQHPACFGFHPLKIHILYQIGQSETVVEAIGEAQAIAEDDFFESLCRAEAYYVRGDVDKFLQVLLTLINRMIPDKKLPSLSRNFESLAQIDEIGKMFDSLADAALRQPDNADILQQLWLSVEANENFSDSKALHETVLDLNPYSYHAWYNLGYAYLGLNDPKNAMEAFEFSHITNRYFEPGYREFAQLAFNSGRFRSALYCYQELVENLGEEPDVMVRIGECYHRLGDAKIARAMYEKALKMDPFHAEAYFKIGEFFASQKEYHAALKWLREAIRKEEKRGDFHAALAEVCYCIGKVQDAEDHFWRAVELAPDEQPQWTRLVKFYMAVGKPEDALETLSSALDNAVEQNELLYCHSACLFLLGKRNQAIKQLRKALTADFSCREALFHTVPALVHDNEVRRLIESFQ